jgi:hypothetical protein
MMSVPVGAGVDPMELAVAQPHEAEPWVYLPLYYGKAFSPKDDAET